jgi:hypothetical protein
MRWLLIAAAACSSEAPIERPTAEPAPPPSPTKASIADTSARYQLRFRGVPVGYSEISVRRRAGGYRYLRADTLAINRDGVRVETRTRLVIDTDSELAPGQVELSSAVGPLSRRVTASRDDSGWTIHRHGGSSTRTGGDLGVYEIAALATSNDRRAVLVPAAAFARAELSSRRRGDQLTLELATTLGTSRTEIVGAADGLPASWHSETGESAVRIEGGLLPELDGVELLALAAMPGGGRRTGRVRIREVHRPAPPTIASQIATTDGDDWIVRFVRPPAPIPEHLVDLVKLVSDTIDDDMGLPGLEADEALRMGRGDCTGHATAFAALARQRGMRVTIATGYRRAGRRWLRHRWAVVEIGDAQVFVDPSFAEARPKPDRLLALAIHGDSADEIAVADMIAFSGMANAVAHFE